MNNSDFLDDAPLYKALKRHIDKGMSSFHTPGHKSSSEIQLPDVSFDLTELPDTDSLFECSGAIREAEIKAARLFGAKYTAISAGGCTLAIQGMIAAFAKIGDKVIFSRNLHRSAVNACVLLGLKPEWMLHRDDCGLGLTGRIHPDDVRGALEKNPDAAAVYITSPDYYGCMSDVNAISAVCRQYNIPLLVDNAHGTHLIAFGRHPMQLGADASACSAHKTLPVLTGGAWLNCGSERAVEKIKSAMSLFGSTSPSYMVMASLDIARAWMEKDGIKKFAETAKIVQELRALALNSGFEIPQGECDPTRLTLLTQSTGFSGNEAAAYFRQMQVECEYSDKAAVVFIITPFNSGNDISRLRNAISGFNPRPCSDNSCKRCDFRLETPPDRGMYPRQAFQLESTTIPAAQSVGRIAAEVKAVCPPGIPVIMPGEIINEQCMKIMISSGITEISVLKYNE